MGQENLHSFLDSAVVAAKCWFHQTVWALTSVKRKTTACVSLPPVVAPASEKLLGVCDLGLVGKRREDLEETHSESQRRCWQGQLIHSSFSGLVFFSELKKVIQQAEHKGSTYCSNGYAFP